MVGRLQPFWPSRDILILFQSEIPALTVGFLSLIGGVIGFARKGSVPSLLGGLSYVAYPRPAVRTFQPIR